MAAYVVAIRDKTLDASELGAYGAAARATMAGHKVIPRAAYGRLKVLEGPPAEGVVILEFPTMEEAQAWYDSPAYAKAREHRFRGAEYRFMIVESV